MDWKDYLDKGFNANEEEAPAEESGMHSILVLYTALMNVGTWGIWVSTEDH